MGASCIYCGSSRIAWRSEGHIVCQDCGSVIEEELIDDGSYGGPRREDQEADGPRRSKIPGFINIREIARASPRSLTGFDVYKHLKGDELLEYIYNELSSTWPSTGRARTRAALALFIYYRILGYSKRASIIESCRRLKMSPKTLEKYVSEFKPLIEEIRYRALTSWARTQQASLKQYKSQHTVRY